MGPSTVFLKIFESQLCSHGSVEVEPRVDLLLAAQGIYPVYLSCDFNCLGGYTPGSSFGHMGIANIGSETDKCRLSLGWTNTYQPGSTNSLVYTLATDMGIIVACNGGGFGFFGDGGLVVDSGRGVTSGGGMCWAAPAEGSGDVRCRALCGNQDGMWVAPELTITEASEITTNTQHLGTITRQLV